MNIDSFSFTSAGGRAYNEDAVGEKSLQEGGIYVLADGLGGHLHGEVASACLVDTVLTGLDLELPPQQALEQCITAANERLLSLQDQGRGKMKTTAVCLLLQNGQANWAHVGDSRLYYLHDGAIAAITADHSVAYKKYLAGEIRRSQIPMDEDQSSLLRALGNPTRNAPAFGEAKVSAGDGFLLCSDGLWEYLRDQEILVDLCKTQTAKAWGQQLLLRAMERIQPGNDNLSLITVRIS